MAETLVELVAKIKADSSELEKGLSTAERQTEASAKKMAESLKKVGIAMAASGAAMTAALGLMGKAAIDEEINIKRLATTINNSGTAYDKVKDSLEAVIAATQRKTGIADNDQRDVLNRLILVTNNYNKALSLLPTVLDLAAAGGMDATTAATYLGKAYLELEQGAESVSVRFGQASLQFKNMEDIQNRVRGSAENLANPLNILRATMGDLSESIGSFLIPTIKDLVNRFAAISEGIQNWIKLNPSLVEQLVLSTAKLGILLTTIGALILILPKIVGFIAMMTGLLGPWGWAILAASVVVGYLVAELLGLSDVMAGLKGIMADVEKQMFIMRAEQSLSAEEWAKIKEQGYLTEQQFISLAKAMKLSTKELYTQMQAMGILEVVMTSLGDTNIYLTTKTKEASNEMDDMETILNKVASASKKVTRELEGTKQSIARATWEADGYTYSMQLFSQAEIDAALASGKKIENLRTQADVTADNIKKAEGYKETLDDATRSVGKFGEALRVGFGGKEFFPGMSPVQVAYQLGYDFQNLTPSEYNEIAGITGVPEFQHGGIVTQPTLAMVGESGAEAIIPLNETGGMGGITINFTQPIFFDREDSMNKFIDKIFKALDRKFRIHKGVSLYG